MTPLLSFTPFTLEVRRLMSDHAEVPLVRHRRRLRCLDHRVQRNCDHRDPADSRHELQMIADNFYSWCAFTEVDQFCDKGGGLRL